MPSSGLIPRLRPAARVDLSVNAPLAFSSSVGIWTSPRPDHPSGNTGSPVNNELSLWGFHLPQAARIDAFAVDIPSGTANLDLHLGLYAGGANRTLQTPTDLVCSTSLIGITTTGTKVGITTPATLQPGFYFTAMLPIGTSMPSFRLMSEPRAGHSYWHGLMNTAVWGSGDSGPGGNRGNAPSLMWSAAGQTALPNSARYLQRKGDSSGTNLGVLIFMRLAAA